MIRQALDEQKKSLAAVSSAKTADEPMTLYRFGQIQTNVEQARDWFSLAATQGEASTRQVEKASATTAR